MLSPTERSFIRDCVDSIVQAMRESDPSLTPGEIYDAIVQELERRCRYVIERI